MRRFKLVRISKENPDVLDAKFTGYCQFNPTLEFFDFFGQAAPRVSHLDHIKYKYLVSVDGNSCTWFRMSWYLVTGSLLIKQDTDRFQWWYSAFKPFVHYVPVKEDLSDLLEKIEWAKNNDQEVQKIVQQGKQFALDNLDYIKVMEQYANILNQYSSLLTFKF